MASQPEQQIALAPGPAWVSDDGDAALYVGEAIDTLRRIPDESVDCVWTDPPYLLSNGGITCVAGRMVSVDKGDWDKSRGLELDHQFNLEWTAECYRVLKPTGTIWVTGTLHVYPSVGMALLRNGFRLLNDIVWEKPNPPPNLGRRTFTHSTEIALWASKAPKGSRHKYTFNYDEMRRENGGKQMKTVWRMTAPGKSEKSFGKHPTQKPVKLIDRCLRASTNPGDLVLDPFAGSGSAGVAALAIGRRFVGIEMSAEFAEIARQRLSSTLALPHDSYGGSENRNYRLFDSVATDYTSVTGITPTTRSQPERDVSVATARYGGGQMERSEAVERLRALMGRDVHEVAREYGISTTGPSGKVNKGWAGQAVERFLGLAINSSRAPNFGSWELKVIPLKHVQRRGGGGRKLVFKETMAITMIDPWEVSNKSFEDSHLFQKLQKALIVTRIVGDKVEDPSTFYSVCELDLEGEILEIVKRDYELVRDTIRDPNRGFDSLTGRMGTYIQPRTKGRGHGSTSRAFYARKAFLERFVDLNEQ